MSNFKSSGFYNAIENNYNLNLDKGWKHRHYSNINNVRYAAFEKQTYIGVEEGSYPSIIYSFYLEDVTLANKKNNQMQTKKDSDF